MNHESRIMNHGTWNFRSALAYAVPVVLFLVDRVLKRLSVGATINTGLVGSVPVGSTAALAITITALVVFLWYAIGRTTRTMRGRTATLLVVVGALSNIFDRLTVGGVIDYWPILGLTTINLADMMIVGGALLLVTKKKI